MEIQSNNSAGRLVRTLLIVLILGSNIGCDQVSKTIVRNRIDHHDQFSFLAGHLTVMKVENTGAFLSVGNGLPQPFKFILLGLIPLGALGIGLAYVLTKQRISVVRIVGICFLIGGGIGNIVDRMLYGSVTDFLHLDFGFIQTGIFNMADVSIMTGIGLILVNTYYDSLRARISGRRN